jgi:hypothetical protein
MDFRRPVSPLSNLRFAFPVSGFMLGAILAFVASVSAGCSHYQLGTGGKLGFHTLYVEPIVNRTTLPEAHALISTQLREQFLRDGRVQLVNSAAEADATLSLAVADYRRDVATVRPGDTGLARKFALTLTAAVTLRDNRSGKLLFERRPISAVRDAFTDNGQLQSEYQALPLLAEALSRNVVHAALDVW